MEGGPKQRVLTSSIGEAKPISWSWESVGVGNGMGVGDRGVGYGVGVGGGGGGGNEAYMPVVGIPSGDNWIGSGVGVGIGRGFGLGSSGGPGYSEGSREGSGLGGGSGFSEGRWGGSGSGGGSGYGEGMAEGSGSRGGSGYGDFPGVLHTGHIVGNGKGSSDGTGFGEGYGVGMGSSSVGSRGQPVVSLPIPGSATSQDCQRMRQSVVGGNGGPSRVGQCNMDIRPGIPQFGIDLSVPIGKWQLLQNGEPEQNGHEKPMNNVHHHMANRAHLDDEDDERHKMSMASEPLPPRAPLEEPTEDEN